MNDKYGKSAVIPLHFLKTEMQLDAFHTGVPYFICLLRDEKTYSNAFI